MRAYIIIIFISIGLVGCATEEKQREPSTEARQQMRNMMKTILVDNQKFRDDPLHDEAYFTKKSSGQSPRTTVVGCADSRVHTSKFDVNPIGNVFFVRNIGNQMETCLGSVDYGVLHLKTSLLLILGHSKCGAVAAVTQGTSKLEKSIRRELAPMHVLHETPHPTDQQLAENIAYNVHNQVNTAYKRYLDLINGENLWIVGAVYDFTPEGRGKIKIIQVNDHTDETYISGFLEDVEKYGDYYDDSNRP